MNRLLRSTGRAYAEGDAAADLAWERYAQPALWPTWSPQIARVECSVDRITEGATGLVHGPVGPPVRFVVDAVDEAARTWAWTVRVGPAQVLSAYLVHAVRPRPGGCRTTLEVTAALPLVLAYTPLAWVALTRLVTAPH